ncbi:DSC E3 ubiquitin ligase complex subunit 4 [Ceratocystis fimbriata CBS 114723]|uniref:DSC E3 ubiquitin ligase complex subunit 4 n=1 Tax=Ceratocystis fimbriata CBS 114723 TaxID=1035309 RepID=A0A2C5X5A4_9PEZI|nr:DSC E3 ubiquitin ligase complex subunit 4 [Ceratocystis fimbriata CBS 114723]
MNNDQHITPALGPTHTPGSPESASSLPARPLSSNATSNTAFNTAVPLRRPRVLNRRTRSFSLDGATTPSSRADEPGVGSRSRSFRSQGRKRPSKKPSPALTKKLQFVTNILGSLDSLVYVQLATLYYMECSLFLFLPRVVAHYTYLTPQPENLNISTAAPANLLGILIPNTLAMAWHLLVALPVASEATRGYMHGGIIIDLIGQKPPITRLVLLALDLFIMILQLIMLAVHLDRDNLRTQIDPKRISPLMLLNLISVARALDQAERGMLPSEPLVPSSSTSEGQQQVASAPSSPGDAASEDGSSLLSRNTADAITSHPDRLDELSSGIAVVGEYNLVGTFRKYAAAVRIPKIFLPSSYSSSASREQQNLAPGNYAATLRELGLGGFARLLRARRTAEQTRTPAEATP